MAALSANVHITHSGNPVRIPVRATAADEYYLGAAIFAKAAGRASPAGASGDTFIGICGERKTVTAQDELVDVYVEGVFLLPMASGAVGADGTVLAFDVTGTVSDNFADAVSLAALAAGDIVIGKILSFDSVESRAWVKLHAVAGIGGTGAVAT